jgi:large subunit ribosomal protein L21
MAMKFAIIETGGKQYRVAPGETLTIERLPEGKGSSVSFAKVLLVADLPAGRQVADPNVEIGTPYLTGKVVEGRIVDEGRSDKKIVFRYHAKTRYRKLKTHRQQFTKVEITKI